MASKIMPATKDELTEAEQLRDKKAFEKGILKIIDIAESEGYRVIYTVDNGRVGILMPSRNVLHWDFNPRSLDFLHYSNEAELRDAALYAELVASSIFDKDITKMIS